MKAYRTAWRTALGTALLCTLGGCFWATTKHEGRELRKDVDRLDGEVKKQDTQVATKVAELQKVLDQATKVLQRNSANIGAEVDALERDGAELRGLVMSAKRLSDGIQSEAKAQTERLDALEKRIAALETKTAAPPPKSAKELFQSGKKLFDAKQYAMARSEFRQIVVHHARDPLAAEAQYYRGEASYRERDYKSAIGEFQKVFDKFPRSRRADEALFRAGESATALKWCTDARAYFGLLAQRYPKSSLLKRAKRNSAKLKKSKGNKKVCKS